MTEERIAAITRLYETRNDHLPEPTRKTHAASGFAHNTKVKVSCEDCLANPAPRFGCETCGGRGYVLVYRERDPMAVNDKVLPYGLDGNHHDRTVAVESAIQAAQRELKRFPGFRPAGMADELEAANREPYAWELARKQMYRDHDYAALERALDALRQIWPGCKPLSEKWLVFVDKWLPDPLRAPAPEQVLAQPRLKGASLNGLELERRNARIREWDRQGKSRAWIQGVTGLGVRQLREIINQRSKEAA